MSDDFDSLLGCPPYSAEYSVDSLCPIQTVQYMDKTSQDVQITFNVNQALDSQTKQTQTNVEPWKTIETYENIELIKSKGSRKKKQVVKILTKVLLDRFLRSKAKFTPTSIADELNLRNDKRRIYDVLCVFEGCEIILKKGKYYSIV